MTKIACPNCNYEIEVDDKDDVGRIGRIFIGIFLWLCIPAFSYGCYIHWNEWLDKYSMLEFTIYSFFTVLLLYTFGWIGYSLIFNKKPMRVEENK